MVRRRNEAQGPIAMGRHLENTWRLARTEPLLFWGGGLLVQAVVSFSLGILAGPMLAGYFRLLLRWHRGQRGLGLAELFAGFSSLGRLLPFFFLGLLLLAGFGFFVVPGLIFATWWLYTIVLLAQRDIGLLEAMHVSRMKVQTVGFFPHLLFVLLITLVPALLVQVMGLLIPPLAVLQLAVLPIQCAALASLYREQFDLT